MKLLKWCVLLVVLVLLFFTARSVYALSITQGPTVTAVSDERERFIHHNEFIAGNFTVSWETDEPTTAQVNYGQGNTNLSSYLYPSLSYKHSVRLQHRVVRNGAYTFQVVSKNANGDTVTASGNVTIPNISQWWETGHANWYKQYWPFDTNAPQWLWYGNVYRMHVQIAGTIDGAWIQIGRHHQGGSGLRLYVNGQEVGSWPYGFSLKTFNIASFLNQGDNVIVLSQDSGGFELLTEGQVVVNNTPISLKTQTTNLPPQVTWKVATNPSGNWTTLNYNDSSWNAPEIAYTLENGQQVFWDHPYSGPYVTSMISDLPGATTQKDTEKHYSQNLSRSNILRESRYAELFQNRHFLGLDAATWDIINPQATAALENVAQAAPLFPSAETQMKATPPNYAAAISFLNQTDTLLNQASLELDVSHALLNATSQLNNLIGANTVINHGPSQTQLNQIATNVQTARTQIQNNQLANASTTLTTALNQLNSTKQTLENTYNGTISDLNDSKYNPLGWLRLRRNPPFQNNLNNNNVIGLKPDTNFAPAPTNWSVQNSGSLNFLTPFALLNITAASYNFGSPATHIAFHRGNQIVIQSASGTVHNRTTNGTLTANWLLVWNQNNPAQTYLIVLQHQPDQISFVGGTDPIQLQRAGGIGEFVVYALYADGASLNGSTAAITSWPSGLPATVQADITFWSQALTQVPLNYTELYQENPTTSSVKIKYHFHALSDDWNTPALYIAPLPQVLSYARSVNYPGINLTQTVRNTNYQTNSWGPFEVVQLTSADQTLDYSFPKFQGAGYMQGLNTEEGSNNNDIQKAAQLGFSAVRLFFRGILTGPEGSAAPLRSDFANTLVPTIDAANNLGLKVVVVVWSAVDEATLEGNRTNVINGWRDIATALAGKNVAYDLVNEPDYGAASTYNQTMQEIVDAIRSQDTTNPIVIEGYRDFARNFSGVAIPTDPSNKIIFEHHPYPKGYSHTYNTIDAAYPGWVMYYDENTYYDQDAYIEAPDEGWLGLIKRKLQNPALELLSGEFGAQVGGPQGSREKLLQDVTDFYRRFGIHFTYFTATGWTMFDLYAGSGSTYQEDTAAINALLGQPLPITNPSPSPSPAPSPIPDANGDGQVDAADFAIWKNNYAQSTGNGIPSGDFNLSGKVEAIDFGMWYHEFVQ